MSMPTASADPAIRARKIASIVLRRVHSGTTQDAIAASMGVNPSTVSRLLSEHLDKLALVLVHAGLRVVDENKRCYDPEYVEALMLLAREHMQRTQLARELDWDE
jgi:DNA-binding NarL/FixJ family response regulator